MTWGVLVLATLASYRLTRLICLDEISEPWRTSLLRRFPPSDDRGTTVHRWPVRWVNCPWCVSVWTSAVLTLAVQGAGYSYGWAFDAIAWLAVAAAVGLLFRLEF